MVNNTVYIDHFGDFYLSIYYYRRLMNCIDCQADSLSSCSKEGSIGINIAKIADRCDDHCSHRVPVHPEPGQVDPQMGCNEDASLIYQCDEESRENSCHKHSLFVDCITAFWPYCFSCFFDLFCNIQCRLMCDIFHKQKSNVASIVDIDQTADITCLVWDKPPEDYLTIQFRFCLQDFSTCFDNIVSDTRPGLFRDLCQNSQKFVNSDRHVIINKSLAWGWPSGDSEFPTDAQWLG